jgi:hypothetical protein
MTTLGHSWSGWCTKANWTCGRLRLGRNENLQNIVPVNMDIGIDALSTVVGSRINNKSIVGVNISRQSAG